MPAGGGRGDEVELLSGQENEEKQPQVVGEAQAGYLGGKLGLEGRAALDTEPPGFL